MSKLLQTNLDANNVARILNLPAPASANEPARQIDLQNAIEGLNWKDNARAASVANINLAAPGATVDGVAMAVNDTFIAKDQTTPAENGKYVWNGAATPATRAADMNAATEFLNAVVSIDEGTTNAGTTWRQTAVNITVGTTAIAFAAFATGAAAATTGTPGIAALATQGEVDAGAVTNKIVTPATLAAAANAKKKFSAAVGDGSATSYTITHNLNTVDVTVAVFVVATGAEVICDVNRTSVNAVQLVFASAPAASAYRVVILG